MKMCDVCPSLTSVLYVQLRKKKVAVLLRMVDELEADLAEEPEVAEQEMQSNASDHEGSDKDMMQE